MKIVHLTSGHSAFDGRIFEKECTALARAGYDVTVIAPHDTNEQRDGIQVVAVPKRRSRRERMTRTVLDVYRAAIRENGDLYHFHDPNLLVIAPLLRLRGKLVIYDAHEHLRRQILAKEYIPLLLRPIAACLLAGAERLFTLFCHAVVAAVPAIAQPFPKTKAAVVCNFPRAEQIVTADRRTDSNFEVPYIVYPGPMSAVRGIKELVDAVAEVAKVRPIRLKLAGNFATEQYAREVRSSPGWAYTDFLGWRTGMEVIELLAGAKSGIVTEFPTPNHFISYPTKLFEYMAAGLPVIASDLPLWRAFVEGAACGLVVNPRSKDEIAEKITWLLDHPAEAKQMGDNGRAAVLRQYNWEAESRTLLALYESLGLRPARLES